MSRLFAETVLSGESRSFVAALLRMTAKYSFHIKLLEEEPEWRSPRSWLEP